MATEAKVLADSINEKGVRLTSFQSTFQRKVLAEVNTHCVLSRNSASSRAIPVEKMLKRFEEDFAWPVAWTSEQPGMSGGAELEGDDLEDAKSLLLTVKWSTGTKIKEYLEAHPDKSTRLHKSRINRLMEWGQWHTAVMTGTAWNNFFLQRLHKDAEPEIRELAVAMKEAMEDSKPTELAEGEWHLPYIDEETRAEITERAEGVGDPDLRPSWIGNQLSRISAARCARVSYLTQEGKRDLLEDVKLYARLVERDDPNDPRHWSPLEHVATPHLSNRQEGYLEVPNTDYVTTPRTFPLGHLPKVGKLPTWLSLRHVEEARLRVVTFS